MNYRNKEQIFQAIKFTEELKANREEWPHWMKKLWDADASKDAALLLMPMGGNRASEDLGYSTKPGAPIRKINIGDYIVHVVTKAKDREGNEVDVTLVQHMPAAEFEKAYELADVQESENERPMEIRDIRESREGKLLLAALAKISTESQTDKHPDEILQQVCQLSHEMEKQKAEQPEVELSEDDIAKLHSTNQN